jgi:hypothetical protein
MMKERLERLVSRIKESAKTCRSGLRAGAASALILGGSMLAANNANAQGTQYFSKGWTMIGNTPTSGSTTNFSTSFTNDATLTWNWGTNFWLNLSTNPVAGGTFDRASGYFFKDTNFTINASPAVGYNFSSWTGNTNGCTFGPSNITVAMSGARAITGNFSKILCTITSSLIGEGAGTISPSGAVSVAYGDSTNFTFTASQPSSRLEAMIRDGSTVYTNTTHDNSTTTTNYLTGVVTADGYITFNAGLKEMKVIVKSERDDPTHSGTNYFRYGKSEDFSVTSPTDH